MTDRYRKKPIPVEAVQLTEDADWEEIARWCGGRIESRDDDPGGEPYRVLVFTTLHGEVEVWDTFVVKGPAGDFWPVRADIFAQTYEPADLPPTDEWTSENASVEVWRWGPMIRLAIRSETSTGKCIEQSIEDAMDLSRRLVATINADRRRVKDDPRA